MSRALDGNVVQEEDRRGPALRVAPYVVVTVLGFFVATAGREIIARLAVPSVVPVLLVGLLAGAFTQMLFALWDRNVATSGWLRFVATVLVAVPSTSCASISLFCGKGASCSS